MAKKESENDEGVTSWLIFLTKSREAANCIADGFGADLKLGGNGIVAVKCGEADGKEIIPAVFYKQGFYYAAAKRYNADCSQSQKHEIIIC